MSENLTPGDLVMVVRCVCPCGATDEFIGRLFTLDCFIPGACSCNRCGLSHRDGIWTMQGYRSRTGFTAPELKRIPPLSELEADNIYNTVPADFRPLPAMKEYNE